MSQIETQIANARKAGHSDQEIFQAILKSPKYGSGFVKARASGLSNDEIAKGLGLNASIKPTKTRSDYKPFDNTKEARTAREKEALKKQGKTQFWESALLGAADIGVPVLQGASWVGDKLSAGLNAVAGTKLDTNSYDRVTKTHKNINQNHETVRKANNQGIDITRIGANILMTAPLAAAGGTLKAGQALTSKPGLEFLGKNAALGALIGATGVHENNTERLKSMGLGAVGGAVGAGVGKKVGDAIVRGRNIATGRMKEGVKEVSDLAKKHGVQTTAGDLGRNPIAQKTEVSLEQIPILGTSKFRETQHDQVKLAASKLTEKLKGKMTSVDYKGVQAIQNAAASGDRNAARIAKVIDDAGDDSSKIIQAGAEVRAWREGKTAGKLYDKVSDLASRQGGQVTPSNATSTLSQKIDSELQSLAPDAELLQNLQRIKTRLDDPNIAKDFGNMRLLRSQLGDLAESYASGASPNKSAAKFMGDLRTSVEKDISEYALNSGNRELINAYKRADGFYSSVMKTKDSAIAKALKSSKPDEIYNQFIKTGKADRAANFYRNLDPKSQAALRYEMANTAFEKSFNQSTEAFSPAKFALEFERMNAPYQSIFKGIDKAEMDGFVKLMRHVERAGQYMENPANGSRLGNMAIGGVAFTNPLTAAKIGISAGTLKALLTTETGKRILLAAKDLPPNSPKFANLLKMMQKAGMLTGAESTSD